MKQPQTFSADLLNCIRSEYRQQLAVAAVVALIFNVSAWVLGSAPLPESQFRFACGWAVGTALVIVFKALFKNLRSRWLWRRHLRQVSDRILDLAHGYDAKTDTVDALAGRKKRQLMRAAARNYFRRNGTTTVPVLDPSFFPSSDNLRLAVEDLGYWNEFDALAQEQKQHPRGAGPLELNPNTALTLDCPLPYNTVLGMAWPVLTEDERRYWQQALADKPQPEKS